MFPNKGKKRLIILLAFLGIIGLIGSDVLDSCCCNQNEFSFLSILAYFLLLLDFLYFVGLDIYNNRKEIDQVGSYSIFKTIDRDKLIVDLKKSIVDKLKDKEHLCQIDASNLTYYDIVNISQKVYQSFSKDRTLHVENKKYALYNIHKPDSFSFEDFNQRLFSDKEHHKKYALYIYDSSTTNPFLIYRIANQLNLIDNIVSIKKKDIKKDKDIKEYLKTIKEYKKNKFLKHVFIIFINKFYKSLNSSDKNTDKIIVLKDIVNQQKKFTEWEEKINESTLKNVTIFEEIYNDSFQRKLMDSFTSFYYLKIGEYNKWNKLSNLSIKDQNYYIYLKADAFHLKNKYNAALNEILDLESKDDLNDDLKLPAIELYLHILKHQGRFEYAIEEKKDRTITKYDEKINKRFISIRYLKELFDVLKNKNYGNITSSINDLIKDIEKYTANTENLSSIHLYMYKAAFIAYSKPLDALQLIEYCIDYMQEYSDRYLFNALYIKGEILKKLNRFDEAYHIYLESSGITVNHIDLNLLDQNYFSCSILEQLELVKGNLSQQILEVKNKYLDVSEDEELLFNQKLLSIIQDNDKECFKALVKDLIFVIL